MLFETRQPGYNHPLRVWVSLWTVVHKSRALREVAFSPFLSTGYVVNIRVKLA